MLPFAVGLALAGTMWVVHGQHLSRRPAHYIDVDFNGIRLMPEGQRVEAGGLRPMVILEREVVSSKVNVSYQATVYAQTADVVLVRVVEQSKTDALTAAEVGQERGREREFVDLRGPASDDRQLGLLESSLAS